MSPPLAGPHVVFVVSRDHGILKMGEEGREGRKGSDRIGEGKEHST